MTPIENDGPADADLSPLDRQREALAFVLMLRGGPPLPPGFQEPPDADDLIARYHAGTLTPFIRTSKIGSPDETPEGADWSKRTWDMPPYKSPAFYSFVGTDLTSFRRLPVYRFAVANGLIVDDEWAGDDERDAFLYPETAWDEPAGGPPTQQGPRR